MHPGKWTCDRHERLFCRECIAADAHAAVKERQMSHLHGATDRTTANLEQRERDLEKRIVELEAALTYIKRETSGPLLLPHTACKLAHDMATEVLRN